jgi:microcystin-dependent protein
MSGVYKVNGISVNPPPGTIIQYLGTTDPDGWVICDGVARTNNADGRYNRLNSMGIGTGGDQTSNYTPPNFINRFSFGKRSSDTLGSVGGNATVTLTSSNLPSHSHNFEHTHTQPAQGTDGAHGWITKVWTTSTIQPTYGNGFLNRNDQYFVRNGIATSLPWAYQNIPTAERSVTSNTGNSTAFSILPSYYIVNNILKY